MLTFIWNARKPLSQPVELFMLYGRLSISLNSCFLPAHYGKTATNKLQEIARNFRIYYLLSFHSGTHLGATQFIRQNSDEDVIESLI